MGSCQKVHRIGKLCFHREWLGRCSLQFLFFFFFQFLVSVLKIYTIYMSILPEFRYCFSIKCNMTSTLEMDRLFKMSLKGALCLSCEEERREKLLTQLYVWVLGAWKYEARFISQLHRLIGWLWTGYSKVLIFSLQVCKVGMRSALQDCTEH